MEWSVIFFNALIDLSNAMAPYILFGLIFAGILHELVPDSIVTKHLGKDNVSSVVKSTVFGIPLPVCSCGVVPLATSDLYTHYWCRLHHGYLWDFRMDIYILSYRQLYDYCDGCRDTYEYL